MVSEAVIASVCKLAADFYQIRSKSMLQLLDESGAVNCFDSLTASILSEHLAGRTALIEKWLLLSADKRVPSGWYFTQHGDSYVVAHYPKGQYEEKELSDPHVACAEFIIHEVARMLANPYFRRKTQT